MVAAIQGANISISGLNQAQGQGRGQRPQGMGPQQLDQAEQRQVAELKSRDTQVRAHEAAHVAAGGGLVRGGASFQYKQGPDGKRYAVGGEVSIDASPVSGDPQATILKAQTVQRAALAPADPSAQDRRVAAQGSQMAAQARMELAKQRMDEQNGGAETARPGKTPITRYRDANGEGREPGNLLDLVS